jgi:hypothetical protein
MQSRISRTFTNKKIRADKDFFGQSCHCPKNRRFYSRKFRRNRIFIRKRGGSGVQMECLREKTRVRRSHDIVPLICLCFTFKHGKFSTFIFIKRTVQIPTEQFSLCAWSTVTCFILLYLQAKIYLQYNTIQYTYFSCVINYFGINTL